MLQPSVGRGVLICADETPAKEAAEEAGRETGAVSTGPNTNATVKR
ncbi:MAG: hypothetical protein ACFFEU_05510 [Candidatus Thorarchaeota archaeon]